MKILKNRKQLLNVYYMIYYIKDSEISFLDLIKN